MLTVHLVLLLELGLTTTIDRLDDADDGDDDTDTAGDGDQDIHEDDKGHAWTVVVIVVVSCW